MHKGNKQKARKFLKKVLNLLGQKRRAPFSSILLASQKVCPIVENKNISKKRRAAFFVPFPRKFKNPETRGLKVLRKSLNNLKDSSFLANTLSDEIRKTLNGKSEAYTQTRKKHKQAVRIKFLRYRRWF